MLYRAEFLATLEAGLRTLLPLWGVADGAALSLLHISENATYLVRDAGRKMVFRVHRPGYNSEAEIVSELAWIAALRADGVVETPAPIPTLAGDATASFADAAGLRHVAAFAHMAGAEPAPGADLPGWFARLGGVNARLHDHARRWQKPPGFIRKHWNVETTVGPEAHWGDWRAALGLDEAGQTIIARAVALLREQTGRYGAAPGRVGLIHCDMRLANLLVEGERLGVIDFDDCGISWFIYDFAAAVSFLEHETYLPELMAAWCEGYRAQAPLAAAAEAALPMFVMLRRIQLTAWVASHAETPSALAVGPAYTDGTVALAERWLSQHG